jgi:hypothetical protein
MLIIHRINGYRRLPTRPHQPTLRVSARESGRQARKRAPSKALPGHWIPVLRGNDKTGQESRLPLDLKALWALVVFHITQPSIALIATRPSLLVAYF